MTGSHGVVNTLINKLPIELHIPGYQFCGPGTKLHQRLKLNHIGINKLDQACRIHDIEYNRFKDLSSRHRADKVLERSAFERLRSKDSTLGEKSSALVVGSIMKLKQKLGMGMRRKRKNVRKHRKRRTGSGIRRKPFRSTIVKPVLNAYKNSKNLMTYKDALKIAKQAVSQAGGRKKIRIPRIIPVPKTGGFLPFLIPLFAGLSAVGSLGAGAAAIAKAVNSAKQAKAQLDEAIRHNKNMESIALGKNATLVKTGNGIRLHISKN